jgi:hypothetical protein
MIANIDQYFQKIENRDMAKKSGKKLYIDHENIVLTRNGMWLADGDEIGHERTRKLFSRSLVKTASGWALKIGREKKDVLVEDTSLFVDRLNGEPQKGFEVEVSDQSCSKLYPETLNYKPGRLTCLVNKTTEAKFLQVPYMELLKFLEEDKNAYYLTVEGKRHNLMTKARK